MKRSIIILLLVFVFTGSRAQSLNSIAGKFIGTQNTTEKSDIIQARNAVLNEEFDEALFLYGRIVKNQISNRAQGNQVNNEIMAEYAFVLALTGAQEAALVNIDLTLNLKFPGPSIYFYVCAVLDLTGFSDLSDLYRKVGKEAPWLNGFGSKLIEKYRSPILLDIGRSDVALRHITDCIKDNRYIEALCHATYLTQLDPSLQAAWLLQSAVFEKLGCYKSALSSFEKGMELFGDREMPGMAKQLAYLKRKSASTGNRLSTWQSGSMVYGGLTYNNRTTSINGRYGIYSGPLSISFNLSLGIPNHGDVSYYAGLSGYYNIGKFFTGMGMGLQSVGKSTTFTVSPTVGVSFINKRRTSSFDISVSWYIPCRSGMKSTLGISIGKTFYFNSNGKTK